MICQGTTKKGDACKKKDSGNGYCKQHQEQVPTPVTDFIKDTDSFVDSDKAHRAAAAFRSLATASRGSAKAFRRLVRAMGGQGGREVRLAVSQRGPRPRRATVGGLGTRSSLVHARKTPRQCDLDATKTLSEYRRWASGRTY